MKTKHFYGKGLPKVDLKSMPGLLIAIEGSDGAGRSVQIALLKDWLGNLGYPTTEIGLKRSGLVSSELAEAMSGNTLNPRTISLFYATDFVDQLENVVIPALRAGFVVIADRYIYSLIARDLVRGADREWLEKLYGVALVPDIRIYLKVKPQLLAERSFEKSGSLNYWESGMDISRSGDMYECFIKYQNKLAKEFKKLCSKYQFTSVDGNQETTVVHKHIQSIVTPLLLAWKSAALPNLSTKVSSGTKAKPSTNSKLVAKKLVNNTKEQKPKIKQPAKVASLARKNSFRKISRKIK